MKSGISKVGDALFIDEKNLFYNIQNQYLIKYIVFLI